MIREALEEDFKVLNELVKEMDANYSFDSNVPFFKCKVYEEKEILGFIKYSLIYDRIEIDYIYVVEKARKKNIATSLLNSLENVSSISLEVNEENIGAIAFYLKNGFEKKAIKKKYYGNKSAILMVKEVLNER